MVVQVAHEVIGTLGESEDSYYDILNKARSRQVKEMIDVNGFQVFPSQVESVKRIFEKYPDFASKFRAKNRHLKSAYMNALLGQIEMLCQSPEELSDDDLEEASVTMSFLADAGFKLDWLEKMLEEVKAIKKTIDSGEALQEMEEELEKHS